MYAAPAIVQRSARVGGYRLPTRVRAVVLLAALLAHLAFMGSPVHARMVSDDSHPADPVAMVAETVDGAPAEWATREEHGGHCVIEWLKESQRTVSTAFLDVFLAAGLSVPQLQIPVIRPAARALGPPTVGDPQALLQVFRE
jgi:hypothetical protein